MSKKKLKVVFFGNHTVGVKVLSILLTRCDIRLVIAHPSDEEDGVVYESVYEFAKKNNIFTIRSKPNDLKVFDLIKSSKPDLILIADYKFLLEREIIDAATLGAINFHPSLLPKYRGRAPLNWAIINGERKFGLTAHFVEEEMDSGDIVCQKAFYLDEIEDVYDALQKLYPLYALMTNEVLDYVESGVVPRTEQIASESTSYPARRPEDGLINWNRPAREVLDFVRALTSPYPGAFINHDGEKLTIWKAKLNKHKNMSKPGKIIYFINDHPVVACKSDSLILMEIEWSINKNKTLKIDDNLN